MKQPILVTGGAGTIGSHTCVALLAAGHQVVVLDNLANSRRSVTQRIERIERIARIREGGVSFVEADICDARALDAVIRRRSWATTPKRSSPVAENNFAPRTRS